MHEPPDRRRPLVLISGKDVLGEVGGGESYTRAHALAAAQAGFAPHVFYIGSRTAVHATEFGTVHTVAAPLGWRGPVALQLPVLARAVARFLGEHPGPHVIHSFAICSGAGVAASRALARRGVTAIPVASAFATRAYEVGAMRDALAAHHGLAHRVRYRAWLRWVELVDHAIEGRGYARSRLVLVNYESVRRILTEAYGPKLEVRRMPYAAVSAFGTAPTPTFSPPEHLARLGSARAPLVVAVSRHDPRKGLDLLLLALADVAAAGIAFRACLVGPGRLLGVHRRLAHELGLSGRVAIPGRVDDVRPYLNQADVFALPSTAEASGSVSVLEALQAGVPVIASDCDGIPEDLVDGVEALLFPSGDGGHSRAPWSPSSPIPSAAPSSRRVRAALTRRSSPPLPSLRDSRAPTRSSASFHDERGAGAYDGRAMARAPAPMIPLGYGKFVRADRVYALVPLEGAERGDRRRTLVHVEGLDAPLVASRSERALAEDVALALGQEPPGGRHGDPRRAGQEALF